MEHIESISVKGLRSFRKAQSLKLAIPNGSLGSGITILVGPNNGGKSTIIEAFTTLSQSSEVSFKEGIRNLSAGDRVRIEANYSSGTKKVLATVEAGGSETTWNEEGVQPTAGNIFVLPSRRTFTPYFGRAQGDRQAYSQDLSVSDVRRPTRDNFSRRLFNIQNDRDGFDAVMKKVLDPVPNWYIDLADNDQHYLKFKTGEAFHTIEGLGEGLVSLLFIIDALYDSQPGNTIVIDEPELSLHPSLQRKLSRLFGEYGKDRQIVISTHSPYFVDWVSIVNGGNVARIFKKNNETLLFEMSEETKTKIEAYLGNVNNPHMLGLNAKEAFFLQERIILVEGQEDVVSFKKILEHLEIKTPGEFFGWGVGGADNMKAIAQLCKELGFERVVGILDKDKKELIPGLEKAFPGYRFHAIPADDVRSKSPQPARPEKRGLLETNGSLRQEHETEMTTLFGRINEYLTT